MVAVGTEWLRYLVSCRRNKRSKYIKYKLLVVV
jgi:hypothetical protein